MIYDAGVDKDVVVRVGGRKFWNAYRINTDTGRVNYYVNEASDPFDRKSPLKMHPARSSLVAAAVVIPRDQLKITRDRKRK